MKDDGPGRLAAWRDAYRAGMAPGSPACPREEELAALALGELQGETRTGVADHVVACRRCADSHRILRELHLEAAGRARARNRAWLGMASAAALVVVAAGVLTSRPPAVPAGASAELRGWEAGAVEPPPGAVLAAAPARLAWTAQPGARGYRARLYDADGDLLWEGTAGAEGRLPLPPEAVAALSPGHSYFWTVVPLDAGVSTRLGPYWFQVSGRP